MSPAMSSTVGETLLEAGHGPPNGATCTDSPSHEATANDAESGHDAATTREIATTRDDTSASTSAVASAGPGSEKSLDPLKPPLPEEIPDEDERLQPALEHLFILAHLAVFAILGVAIRFGLEILFGPLIAHVTDDSQSLFLDVPANMAGSFLMGIVGYTSKKDIAAYSQPLAIGLSTGLCGSITTYGSWNQRMMAILAYGLVVRALFGYVLGTALSWHSFSVGIDAADGLRELVRRHNERQLDRGRKAWQPQPEHFQRRWRSLLLSVGLALVLWLAAALAFSLGQGAKLRKVALGCIVGPFGCWLRWWLSFQNGKGIKVGFGKGKEKQEWFKWIPFGTLTANLTAVVLEAATSSVDSIHNTETGSLVLGGVQLGLLGALSTVSTMICEAHILTKAKEKQWRGYAYLYLVTFLPSILIGLVLYCIPVWVFGVAASGYNPV